jgi:hypothetical protein
MQDPQDGTPTSPGDSQAQSQDSPDDGQLPLSLNDTLENKALSLDVILEAARKRIEEQNALISVLDTKAGFVLGSASLLTAGVGTFARTAFDVSERLSTANLKLDDSSRKGLLILAALALLFYLGIMVCGLLAYRLRKYETLTEIGVLRDLYLTETEATTKLVMLDTLDKAIKGNDPKIKRKASWAQIAVILLVGEAIFLAALIFFQMVLLGWST